VLTYGTPHFSYYYHKTPGEYKKIVDIIAEEFDSHVQVTNGCGMGCNHLVIAEHDLETGNLEKVELNAKKAIYEAKTCDQTCIIVCAKLTLARLYILQNRDADLLAVITELTEMARLENNPVNLNVIENCLGYIYACLEQYKNIPQWLRDGDMAFNSLYQGAAFCNIVYGKAILLSENYLELELKTDNFVHDFKVFNNLLGLIHNHIHNAVAKFHLYGIEAGVQELQKALDIAVQDNVIMPFVENKDHILPMLKSKQLDVPKHYFERLLKFCEQYRREISKIDEANLLSLREYEVFALIESGKSYKYIADKLCISPNTVKRHIQNIYRKLNVTNKVMAIKKYKSLKEEIMK
jgi:LuxR family maltose regulon positive regulatory protein